MIVNCHPRQLEDRCKQRGYALADVMGCVVAQDGGRWTIDTDHPAYPRKVAEWQPVQVGDLVERWLTAIGITQERVERWTRTASKPGGCGCAGRKKWLNHVGAEAQRWLRGRLLRARRFYVGS